MLRRIQKLETLSGLVPGPGHAVRLLEFVAGEILSKVPWQPDFGLQAGREVARLDALLDVSEPRGPHRTRPWRPG